MFFGSCGVGGEFYAIISQSTSQEMTANRRRCATKVPG